jgi:cytochrome c553
MPVIWGQSADYIVKQLNDYRDGGRENQIMSSMAESIPRSKLADAAKIISLKPWPQLDAPVSKVPLPDLAQACTACHGADLMGAITDAGPAPRLAGQNERYLAEQMQAFATGLRANQDMMTVMMRGIDAAQRGILAQHYAP